MRDSRQDFSSISDKQLAYYHKKSKKIETLTKLCLSRHAFFDSRINSASFIDETILSDNIKYWSELRWSLNSERIHRRLNYTDKTDTIFLINQKDIGSTKFTPHLKLFKNIACYPVERWMHPSKGGPDWDDWKNENHGRICIDNKFDDAPCSNDYKLKNKPKATPHKECQPPFVEGEGHFILWSLAFGLSFDFCS